MFKIDSKKRIHVTRGDIGLIEVSAVDGNGDQYFFKPNDVVRFQVMKENNCKCICLRKEVTVEEETSVVTISLSSADTTIGDAVSKPVNYWYEVELNPNTNPQTIIGYDELGAKLFVIYPEGVY